MEFCSYFEQIADSPNFLRKLALEFCLRPKSLKLRQSSNWAANLFKIWQNANAAFVVFYHIPEDYSVDNYSIWCIRKIFYLHLSIPRVQANTVQHTYLIVVSITEIIEYYKNGYLSATVGTRLHLASGWSNDHSGA